MKVSGCPDTLGAIDGVEYLAGVLENAVIFLFTGSLNHLRSQSPAHVYCFYWDQVSDVQYIFVLIISSNLELSS